MVWFFGGNSPLPWAPTTRVTPLPLFQWNRLKQGKRGKQGKGSKLDNLNWVVGAHGRGGFPPKRSNHILRYKIILEHFQKVLSVPCLVYNLSPCSLLLLTFRLLTLYGAKRGSDLFGFAKEGIEIIKNRWLQTQGPLSVKNIAPLRITQFKYDKLIETCEKTSGPAKQAASIKDSCERNNFCTGQCKLIQLYALVQIMGITLHIIMSRLSSAPLRCISTRDQFIALGIDNSFLKVELVFL